MAEKKCSVCGKTDSKKWMKQKASWFCSTQCFDDFNKKSGGDDAGGKCEFC